MSITKLFRYRSLVNQITKICAEYREIVRQESSRYSTYMIKCGKLGEIDGFKGIELSESDADLAIRSMAGDDSKKYGWRLYTYAIMLMHEKMSKADFYITMRVFAHFSIKEATNIIENSGSSCSLTLGLKMREDTSSIENPIFYIPTIDYMNKIEKAIERACS